ncbi:DUF3099 domain-containing protein [Qaidamihabitans albus]|uniref:DUF3099 domain-containing protein n=1 Tax=Qaidamihabitans albus TaxID=2795733 RepID=UPI0018F11C7E|nr:DUF3099 domain-containing protein [Qaidamihabitans albus]
MSEHDKRGTPVLITEAAPSYDDQQAARKRKYVLMMGMRFPCLILAGIFYQTWWLALAFIVLSVPLPWIAVLIANDRPPRKAEEVNRYRREANAIEAGEHRIIDVSPGHRS